jgi:hypothetical protein
VTQESQTTDELFFRIHVRAETETAVLLCKKEDNAWRVLPQSAPQWMSRLEPLLFATIDKKLSNIL